MFIKTKTWTEMVEIVVWEPGDLVQYAGQKRVVEKYIEPFCAEEDGIVFLEGDKYGHTAESVKAWEEKGGVEA